MLNTAALDSLKERVQALTAGLDPIQHLRSLDFPRRVGTPGDTQAAAYIADTLRGIGLEPEVQPFKLAKPRVIGKLVMPLVLAVAALAILNPPWWSSSPILRVLGWLLPVALVLMFVFMDAFMTWTLSKQRQRLAELDDKIASGKVTAERIVESQNVIASLGPEDAEREVLFTAHFDSISSALPMGVSSICRLGGLTGLLLYGLFSLANEIAWDRLAFAEPYAVGVGVAGIALIGVTALARLFRGNTSHGVIDDGTGVAILLELARHLKANPLPNTRFTFGFFSGEEAGLIGSTCYYLNRKVDPAKLRVMTVDMIGEKPPLAYVKGIFVVRKRKMNPEVNAQLIAVAEALGIKLKGRSFPYPGSDFAHFLLHGGCQANWLINSSKMIHSNKDHLGNVNETLVVDALRLMVGWLESRG